MSTIASQVFKPIDAVALTTGGTSSTTSRWLPCEGHARRKISVDLDSSGTPDVNINLYLSHKGEWEMNNKTVDTDDYKSIAVVDALATKTLVSYTVDDVTGLDQPAESFAINAAVDGTSGDTTVNVFYESLS